MQPTYGNLPVPQPVMWSEEEEYYVAVCPWVKRPAICQKEAQGQGVPRFGRPHAGRLRKLMTLGLCDICGKSLRHATKISLSRNLRDAAEDQSLPQVEPLMHAECARLSLKHCPSLQRQLDGERLSIKKVFRYSVRPMLADPEDLQRYVPDYTGPDIVGLTALDLLSWHDVTRDWL